MTIWYVHRRDDGTIASAHGNPQTGYAEEALDDLTNSEIVEWFARVTAPVVLTPQQKLEASGLTVDELKTLLGIT